MAELAGRGHRRQQGQVLPKGLGLGLQGGAVQPHQALGCSHRGKHPSGIAGRHLAAPVAQKRPINPVGLAGAGADLLGRHQQLVPIHQHAPAAGLEGGRHLAIPLAGRRLHVPVPGHHGGAAGLGQARQHVHRAALEKQQLTARLTPALLQLPQALAEKPEPGWS